MKKFYRGIYLFMICICIKCVNVRAESCDSLLGKDLVDEITKIFHTLGYITLLIAIVLGMLDFFKTIVGGDKADLKSVAQKFVKRLLAISLFFILPALINWLLKISGVDNGGTCINN